VPITTNGVSYQMEYTQYLSSTLRASSH